MSASIATTAATEAAKKPVRENPATWLFNIAFDQALDIEFNPDWSNGTGYYDKAVLSKVSPKLNPGEVRRCISAGANNRKIILVGTRLGNVVIFQRYTNSDEVYVTNMHYAIASMTGIRGAVSEDQMNLLLSNGCNIGQRVESFIEEVNDIKEKI